MTGLQFMAVIENIPLNIKNSMICARKCFFYIILATVISGMPSPETCFSPGQFRLTILTKVHHGESLSVCELDTQPSNWEATLYHWAIAAAAKPSSPMPTCQEMLWRAVGRYWETTDTRNTIKLALIIYRDFMQKFLSDFERWGNISRKQLEP